MADTQIYGLMAEFGDPTALVTAARRVREAGYRDIDAFSPFPVPEVIEALRLRDRRLPLLVLIGGIVGAVSGFGLQYWINVINYPLIIGGKPYNAWPNFIPVTFETTILFAAITAVLSLIFLNGLPKPYHPVFNVPRFGHASRDRFFLVVEARDPKFDRHATSEMLRGLAAQEVVEVEN
jgi:hypothetical protein